MKTVKSKNKNMGSNFDDYLKEEGIYEECRAIALKRVISYQLADAMKTNHISKSKMAKLMHTNRTAIDRILDSENDSITLLTIAKAASVLGKKIRFELI